MSLNVLSLFAGIGGLELGLERAATIRRLQSLLASAIEARDDLLARGLDCVPAVDRHWFVAGEGGYCQACNLPRQNKRHAERGD